MFPLLAARLVPYRLIIELAAMAACAAGGLYFGYTYADDAAAARDNERAALAFKEYIKTERENLNLVEQVKVKK